MTPTSDIRHTILDTPLGPLRIVATGDGLSQVTFQEGDPAPGTSGPRRDDDPLLAGARSQLDEYFAGRREVFTLPLAPAGTEFQKRVWAVLQGIPYGETRSYGEVAAQLGQPGASRAVGLANGSNPIAIVVPCHRVVGAKGTLTGYAGGLERKRRLLGLELRLG